uniref:Uncharacterized protein LOC111122604 isoform X5 n=1 Tax=Crassostrea virginica TaxID=6565 RepID=A0A8B8CY10_CRAVI|nr:uncharacterized protein LOC111122604 isoform X5 [Crassostrea virginica]
MYLVATILNAILIATQGLRVSETLGSDTEMTHRIGSNVIQTSECNSDTRYPERIHGVRFIPFPKPKTNEAKCLHWIKACGRPHWQFGQSSINRHTFVCSKHFVDPSGPTVEFPDPLPADGSKLKKTRLHWKLRHDGKSVSTNPDGNAATSVVGETVGMTATESETDDYQQLPIATGDSLELQHTYVNYRTS